MDNVGLWYVCHRISLITICLADTVRIDASFHLSEECSNAAVATPRSIVYTAASGSIMGFFLNL